MAGGKVVAVFRLTSAQALARVRALAADSSNLLWTQHIRERMAERGFDDIDVLRIVRTGDVDSVPGVGTNQGEWKIKVTRRMSNGRVAGVLTVLLVSNKLRLVTVEWEDHL